ncbi:MAG: DUF3052 domain-containing protein [Acidimicrobiales bacterium]
MPAGYSGTPLSKKLGIKPGMVVAVINEPDGFRALLDPLPDDVTFRSALRGNIDLAIAFFTERSKLQVKLPALTKAIYPAGGLWLAWPKKTSGVETDISGNDIRELGLASGVVDIKVAAIDETWSGHRFAHRIKDR